VDHSVVDVVVHMDVYRSVDGIGMEESHIACWSCVGKRRGRDGW
jgi:hypothetical protein